VPRVRHVCDTCHRPRLPLDRAVEVRQRLGGLVDYVVPSLDVLELEPARPLVEAHRGPR
jgi:hypothetical protein